MAAPNRVEKIAIGYAKQAKKMDMRRLKAIEWDLLTSRLISNNKENSVTNNDVAQEGVDDDPKTTEPKDSTTFAKLYKELHSSKMMPAQVFYNVIMSNKINGALSFVHTVVFIKTSRI